MTDTENVQARSISISFVAPQTAQTVCLDPNVTSEIRTPGVDRNVGAGAAIPEVREVRCAFSVALAEWRCSCGRS